MKTVHKLIHTVSSERYLHANVHALTGLKFATDFFALQIIGFGR
ncbi:MAG: hypothetical protein ACLS8R_01360 [Anaeromassilibacillus sp.]